ncbi:MAG: hypothetical protein OHK005_01410 [Candidatus Methylacidiphilales bacterium]
MNKMVYLLGAAACMLGWTSMGQAQTASPLIDALVKKGVITELEGSQIKKEINDDWVTQGGSKIDMGSHVKKLKLYGDARFRYQNDTRSTFAAGAGRSNSQSRDRYRYRLRIGADYTLSEGFKAGVRLATTGAANSTNNTFNNGYAKDGLFIDRVFLDWTPQFSWIPNNVEVNLVGGKTGPQFFLDSVNLDSDINFTGTSQKITYTGISDFKISLVTAQYIPNALLMDNFTPPAGVDGTWQIVVQPAVTYSWEKSHSVTVAPMLLHNVNGSQNNPANPANFLNAGSGVVSTAEISVLYLPVEVKWKAWDQPFKFYYTYSHNFNAGTRDRSLRPAGNGSIMDDASDSHLIGLAVGSTKKKGGWQIDGFYSYRELHSVDPLWVDSDWNAAGTNGRGFGIKTGYAFTDFLVGNITYLYGEKISDQVGGVPGGASAGNTNRTSTLQIDLAYKF